MKAFDIIKLIVLGALISAGGCLLKGHDLLTAIVLISSVLLIATKFYFLYGPPFRGRRGSEPGGDFSLGRPVPIPPVRPRPMEFVQK
jgi:hypothetical protein